MSLSTARERLAFGEAELVSLRIDHDGETGMIVDHRAAELSQLPSERSALGRGDEQVQMKPVLCCFGLRNTLEPDRRPSSGGIDEVDGSLGSGLLHITQRHHPEPAQPLRVVGIDGYLEGPARHVTMVPSHTPLLQLSSPR